MRYLPILAILLVAGCALIDQRTFAPSPEAEAIPVVPTVRVPADPRTPLVTIDYTKPSPNYRDLLRLAVHAAESRSGAVQYDVVAIAPALQSSPPPQALEVMRAIAAENVPPARIHLGARAEPALSALQVRIYVR